MADLDQFAASMTRLADRVERRGPEIQRKTAMEILRLAVLGTPVGNKDIWLEPGKARVGYVGGRARANWFVGIGAAVATVTDNIDAGGESTISAGVGAIEHTPPGTTIHLTNNLPYIVPLNQGHSHQAPEGFIDSAVQRGLEFIKSQRITEDQS